ncbi:MAG: DUF2167 domain-containing protein [Cyanobacteria bacterium]|nr:DUF2167 domain-containing protein [Cyanobacteriota bacterium]
MLLNNEDFWFVVFDFQSTGYVRDTDKKSLDSKGILSSIKEGTEASNKLRKQRGWPTMNIVGWYEEPYYDEATNNLTWAIEGGSGDGETSINHSTRLLGRRGVMRANLVAGRSRRPDRRRHGRSAGEERPAAEIRQGHRRRHRGAARRAEKNVECHDAAQPDGVIAGCLIGSSSACLSPAFISLNVARGHRQRCSRATASRFASGGWPPQAPSFRATSLADWHSRIH